MFDRVPNAFVEAAKRMFGVYIYNPDKENHIVKYHRCDAVGGGRRKTRRRRLA